MKSFESDDCVFALYRNGLCFVFLVHWKMWRALWLLTHVAWFNKCTVAIRRPELIVLLCTTDLEYSLKENNSHDKTWKWKRRRICRKESNNKSSVAYYQEKRQQPSMISSKTQRKSCNTCCGTKWEAVCTHLRLFWHTRRYEATYRMYDFAHTFFLLWKRAAKTPTDAKLKHICAVFY